MYIGNEPLRVGGHDIAQTMNDFWRWSFSDFTDFSVRAAFSEFLVASSLELLSNGNGRLRRTHDLLWSPQGGTGLKVGVRTAAYVQSDEAEHPEHILFPIPNEHTCNVYVFCVFKAMMQEESPLDTDLWDFYSLRSLAVGRGMPNRDFITLPALRALGPVWSDYYGIGGAIQKTMAAHAV